MKLCLNNYNTDKSVAYMQVYDRHFAPLRHDKITLLELGIFKGGSLLLWKDYFPNGRIAGIDINPIHLQDDSNRIRVYQGSQGDIAFLERVASDMVGMTGFDIIIDDASHIASLTRTSFWYLFDNHLKRGGIYVIEDWGTGYWEDWPDGSRFEGSNHDRGMVTFIKELVDECGMADITKNKHNMLPYRESKFESLYITHGQVVIIKK